MVARRPPQAEAPRLADAAYATIKRQITELYLPPGATFTETGLLQSTGLSRTPMREALARLRMEGWVVVDPWRVAPISIGDVRELWEVRALLESKAVSLAVHRIESAEQLQELEQLGCAMSYDPADHESISAFVQSNTAFHARLAEIGGNRRLTTALRSVLEQQERIVHVAFALGVEVEPEEWAVEHRALIRAVTSGDEAHAAAVANAQSSESLARIIQALKDSEHFANAPINVVRESPGA